jgi:hypothetical protein
MAIPIPRTYDELLEHLFTVHGLLNEPWCAWDFLGIDEIRSIHDTIHDENTRIHHHMPADG